MRPMNKDDRAFVAALSDEDFGTIGINVRFMRQIRGWTQTVLAQRSGVSRTTLKRIEDGTPGFGQTVFKIAQAFEVPLSELVVTKRFQNVLDETDRRVIHRRERDYWFALEDKRLKKPLDSHELIQDPAERRRLGELGYVPAFACGMDFFLPVGPGINRLELYGRLDQPRMLQYNVNALHCLDGEIRVVWEDEEVVLFPQDVIALRTKEPFYLEPVQKPNVAWPARAMLLGADRCRVEMER